MNPSRTAVSPPASGRVFIQPGCRPSRTPRRPARAASSPPEKTRSTSRMITNWSSRLPIPRMNSVRRLAPMRGAGSICPGARSMTSSHRVGERPEHGALARQIDLEDDDARVHRALGGRHAELEVQIHHRDDRPPQVGHPAHEGRHPGHPGDLRVVEHLAHLRDVEREDLLAEPERQVLGRRVNCCRRHRSAPPSELHELGVLGVAAALAHVEGDAVVTGGLHSGQGSRGAALSALFVL